MPNKTLPHAWTHGAGRHPTRDAECSCGAGCDITPGKPLRTVRYASETGGELSDKLPPCTRGRHAGDIAWTEDER